VAEIRYGLLRQTEEELQTLTEKAAAEGGRSTKLLKEQVDEEDVAAHRIAVEQAFRFRKCSKAR